MTNHNPAISQSNSQIERDILAKVNAHADRSLDRLFADIDELLNGDGDTKTRTPNRDDGSDRPPTTENFQQQLPSDERLDFELRQLPGTDFSPAAPEREPQAAKAAKTKKHLPLWLKVLMGVGATTLAVGGGLAWMVKEGKVEIPKTLDTSWLPFQSKVAPADLKFGEYLRKSIANIEANANKPTPLAMPAAAPTNAIGQSESYANAPLAVTPTPAGATILATTATNPTPAVKFELVKTVQNGKQSSAMFQFGQERKMINIGQKIGTSDWSLLTVAKNEVLVKRKGGELRSVYVGQKF